MRSYLIVSAAAISFFALGSPVVYGASATAGPVYPASEVSIGTPVSFSVTTSGFTDPSFSLEDSFPGGVTNVNLDSDGNFTWTPNQDEIGMHNLTITVTDAQGDSATAMQTIQVDGAPSLSIGTLTPGPSVSIGVPLSFTVTQSGLFSPTYSVTDSFPDSSLNPYGAIQASGAFAWTPNTQDIGSHTLTVLAKDTYGNTASASVAVSVLPDLEAWIRALTPGTSIDVGQPFSFTATSTGLINPSYAVSDSFVGTATSTVAVDPSGHVTWTPQYSDIGGHTLTVLISDSSGRSISASVQVTVLPETAPTAPLPPTPVSLPPPQSSAPAQSATKPASLSHARPAASVSVVHNASTPPSASLAQTATQQSEVASATPPTAAQASTSAPEQMPPPVPEAPPMTEPIGAFLLGAVAHFFASLFTLL